MDGPSFGEMALEQALAELCELDTTLLTDMEGSLGQGEARAALGPCLPGPRRALRSGRRLGAVHAGLSNVSGLRCGPWGPAFPASAIGVSRSALGCGPSGATPRWVPWRLGSGHVRL